MYGRGKHSIVKQLSFSYKYLNLFKKEKQCRSSLGERRDFLSNTEKSKTYVFANTCLPQPTRLSLISNWVATWS